MAGGAGRDKAPQPEGEPVSNALKWSDIEPETAPEPLVPSEGYSDDALALRFSAQHGNDLRYVAQWGRWLRWNGTRWEEDQTVLVFDMVRRVCREAAEEVEDERQAARIRSAMTVAAVERLARSDRRHAAIVEQWDSNPWLLNTPKGIVDLKTGKLQPAKREDYATKATATVPGGDCPTWAKFLDRITGGDADLQRYLQVVAGYSLTGLTIEHALFFLHGCGANGKSVFVSTLAGIIGDYAKTAPMATFTESRTEQHPTDLAALQGARLVVSTETEDGRRWAEAKIKSLTGGDRISARYMRMDFFEYTPQFKLLISGNHRPGLRGVDESIRRRLQLVPFAVTIPEAERDLRLTEKLKAEWPGILAWAVQGCLLWQGEGIYQPDAVRAATGDYLSSEDALLRWVEDCCESGPNLWSSGSALFASWKGWADANNEYAGSQKRFSEQMASHGFQQVRTRAARGFSGIAIREPSVTDVTGSQIIGVHARARNGDNREKCHIRHKPSESVAAPVNELPTAAPVAYEVDDL